MIDTSAMVPGRIYIIDGKRYAKCGSCGKILCMEYWWSDIHLCD